MYAQELSKQTLLEIKLQINFFKYLSTTQNKHYWIVLHYASENYWKLKKILPDEVYHAPKTSRNTEVHMISD